MGTAGTENAAPENWAPLSHVLDTVPAGPRLGGLHGRRVDQATLAGIADLFALPDDLGLEHLLSPYMTQSADKPVTAQL